MKVMRVFLFAMVVWLFICAPASASNWSIELKSGYWHSFEKKFFGTNGLVSDAVELEVELKYSYQLKFIRSNLAFSSMLDFTQAEVAIEAAPEDSPPWVGRIKLGRWTRVPMMVWASYGLLLDKFSPYIGIGAGYALNHFSDNSRIADVHMDNAWIFGARGGIRYAISEGWFIGTDFKYTWGHAKIFERKLPGLDLCDS